MEENIRWICGELQFPKEATEAMCAAWQSIVRNGQTEFWISWYNRYEDEGTEMDFELAADMVNEQADAFDIHPYTAELLLFLILCRHLRELYIERNISLQIWHDSCMDLHWKLMECKKLHGIWGSFVGWWFAEFFQLRRFALGRLQFEASEFPYRYEEAGYVKPEGMEYVIGVHIPSGSSLRKEECIASYKAAAELFPKLFEDEYDEKCVAFVCESWLLFDAHRAFLKPDSGIVRFMDDYMIYYTEYGEGDLWRIFNCEYNGDPDCLPEDTALQRGYKALLKSGQRPGYSHGIFVMKKA